MKGSLYIGAVRGIKMYIHWSFSLLLLWVIGNYFNEEEVAHSLAYQLLFILAVFGCVLLHELGHALSALRYGVKTHDITLLPIGGVARLERIPENPKQELVVAAAGPAVNVVIALLLLIVMAVTNGFPDGFNLQSLLTGGFVTELMAVNISLVVFNLIPAFPMDGGRMLRATLAIKMKREKATRIAAGLGQLLAIGFMIFGFMYNPVLLFIGLFIFMGARTESQMVTRAAMLKAVTVKQVMVTDFKRLHEHDTLKVAVDQWLAVDQQDFLVVDSLGAVTGVLTRNQLLSGISAYGIETPVQSIMSVVMQGVHMEDSAMEQYQHMLESKVAVAPVYEGAVVTGMLTLNTIRHYYLVKHSVELQRT